MTRGDGTAGRNGSVATATTTTTTTTTTTAPPVGDGVLRPTVVELVDGATVVSPHADSGGTATTTVAFKMNVWADGGSTMTLTSTSTTHVHCGVSICGSNGS